MYADGTLELRKRGAKVGPLEKGALPVMGVSDKEVGNWLIRRVCQYTGNPRRYMLTGFSGETKDIAKVADFLKFVLRNTSEKKPITIAQYQKLRGTFTCEGTSALKWGINLSSDDFGTEHFEYDSLEDAVDGFNRLTLSCRKEFSKDDINRKLELVGASLLIDHDLPSKPLKL